MERNPKRSIEEQFAEIMKRRNMYVSYMTPLIVQMLVEADEMKYIRRHTTG